MANIEGTFMGRPASCRLQRNGKNQPEIKIMFEIVGGQHAGQLVPYNGKFTERACKYTHRDLSELGWKGKTIATAPADVMTNPKPISIEVRIAKYEDREWSSVDRIGSGDGSKPIDDAGVKEIDGYLGEIGTGDDKDIPF